MNPLALPPATVFRLEAVGKVEMDRRIAFLCKQIFGTQAHYRIGTLLEVAFAGINIEHGTMHILPGLGSAIVQQDRRSVVQQRKVPQISRKSGGIGGYTNVARGNREPDFYCVSPGINYRRNGICADGQRILGGLTV